MGEPLSRSQALAAAVMAVALVMAGRGASAQISPGPMSQAHAELDGSDSCLSCHSSGRGVDPARCFSCHGPLSQRVKAGQGLHARADYRACERCHIEHQGRGFELVYWGKAGQAAFNHALTGWRLEGRHARLECRQCHQPAKLQETARLKAGKVNLDKTFLGLGTTCAACHADPHAGQFATTGCASCHGQESFKPTSGFDHQKTAFVLAGEHSAVPCAGCHRPVSSGAVRYRGLSSDCASCHQDPHQGRFGHACASCHTVAAWSEINRSGFDHRRTGYPLEGRHARVACEDCHRPGRPMKIAGAERCASCHADPHGGQFQARAAAGECGECHTVAGFVPSRFTLAQHQATRYPLEGAHARARCAGCHGEATPATIEQAGAVLAFAGPRPATLERFRFAATTCPDCHADPHRGDARAYLGADGCRSCHGLERWREVRFDHRRTHFALEGAHAKKGCIDCHRPSEAGKAGREIRLAGAPRECLGCHVDPHFAQFDRGGTPRPCTECHGLEAWAPSHFDHDRDAAFKLEGAHRAVACVGCHARESLGGKSFVRYRPLGSSCTDCHGAEVKP